MGLRNNFTDVPVDFWTEPLDIGDFIDIHFPFERCDALEEFLSQNIPYRVLIEDVER